MEPLHKIVPAGLRERPQWVLWKYTERGGKRTKMPIAALTGKAASSTDASTWVPFDDAVAATRRFASIAGVGFVFTPDDPFCGIDLDECIADDRVVPEAQSIIDTLNSYTEVSPSGNGVKIIVQAKKPDGVGCKSTKIDGFKEIEIYDTERFFTITGRMLADTPLHVENRQEEVLGLCRRLWPLRSAPKGTRRFTGGFSGSDDELIRLATAAKNGAVFERLLHGDLSDYGGDHSRADLAFCNMLAFWTGRDPNRMDRIFRASGLYREKWERADYRGWTIDKAIESCTEVFTPSDSEKGVDLSSIGSKPKPVVPSISDPETDSSSISRLMTDVGNAARLVHRYGNRIRFCYGPGQWLIWDGKRWKPDDRGRIIKLCKATALAIFDEAKQAEGDLQEELVRWAMMSQKRDRLTAMAALAQPEVAVGPDDLDADPWAFNVNNGTIDLRTGELRPHRRDDLITKIAPVEYDDTARAPRFDRFLEEIFGGDRDLIQFVQRWHGHCLSADIREQYLPIYHGEGNNGKSVLLDTISAVMGDYVGEAPPDLITVRKHPEHPTEIADLMGRRLVIASETERDAELRLQLIKRLTGNARLKARLMRQDYFEFARSHKMILVTNNRPSIREDTEAAWRRLRLVPFEVVIPKAKRDADLMRKLSSEKSGILAWLVQGCVDWLREGLTEPSAVMAATEAYRGCANSLDAFLLDRCVLGEGLACVTSELMAAYGGWCAQNKRVPIRGRAFAAALKERQCMPTKIGGQRHWIGLALDDGPSGQNGRNGRELPVERRTAPHEGDNGNIPSNPSNVSTGRSGASAERPVTGGVTDG